MDRAPTCANCSGGDAGNPQTTTSDVPVRTNLVDGWSHDDCEGAEKCERDGCENCCYCGRELDYDEPQKPMREPETVEKAGIPLRCRLGWHLWGRWRDCEVTAVHRVSSRYSWKEDRPGQTRECYLCGLKEYR